MSSARKFFSETCSLPSATATRVGTIMATAGWGFEPGANNSISTTPSLDSTIGTSLSLTPTAGIWIGHDQYVRDSAGAGPPRTYKGVFAAAGEAFDVAEYTRGLVDINEVWVYTPGLAQEVEVVFKGI